MPGITKLKKIQLGLESAKGTEHDATALWLGDGDLTDGRMTVIPNENIGYIIPVDRSYIPFAESDIALKSIEANYEQIGYPFSAGVKDTVTGTATGGTSDGYSYDYTMPTTTPPNVKSYTIEGGDNQQEYQCLYGFCEEIKLSGLPKEAVKIESKWKARSMAKGTFTGAIGVPTVEQILFQNGKIYWDYASAIGTTQLTNTWLGFDLTLKTGLIPIYTGDGSIYFSFDKCTEPDITGSITFEHDAVGVARYDDFVAGNTGLVRMKFPGSALAGAGGTFTTKMLQIDMAVKIMSIAPLGSINGNNVVKVNYRAVYNATKSLYAVFTVCNKLAALA